jgi:outer membrane protein OmpA-like peptidoglycan-associated protein
MRPLPLLSAVLLTLATHAFAQVTVDLHALQALPDHGGKPAPAQNPVQHQTGRTRTITQRAEPPPPGGTQTEVPASGSKTAATTPASPPAASPGAPPQTAAASPLTPTAPPALPQTVPQTAMITPIAPAPPAGAAPPPPPVSATAATNAAPTVSGLRLGFASGQSDLTPESVASIKRLASATPPGDAASFNVLAYAPGSPDDPSTARRVSLSRAMAVRSALVANGVPSARIYVRALGAQYGDGPPDRVDVNVQGAADSGPTAAQAPPR